MRKYIWRIALSTLIFNGLQAQRNVMVIIADDLSPDFFGFYETHGDTVDVPNIRSLVKRGIRFTNGMSNPVCSSTRAAMFSGRYGFRTGVGGIVGGAGGSNQLDTSEITIPKLLRLYDPNIAKADIGKWHLHQPMPASNLLNPNKMGYDHFEGPFIGQLPSFTNWTKYTNGVASTVTTYATTENVNNAVTWLKSINSRPFFLWLAFNAPHEPLHLPPAGLHQFTNLTGTANDIKNNPKSYFKAMIQAMDKEMGRLFDTLRVMNQFDNTDIFFIGDNGSTPRTAQTADTSKAKGTVYQYGVNTPFIFAGPSVVNPNRVSTALVNTTDVFATVLELFGYTTWQSKIPVNKPVDSKSLLPIIKDQSLEVRPWSFCENFKLTPDANDGKGIRNKSYKLIRFDAGRQEFYNLSVDPGEAKDLLKGKMTAEDITNYYYLCNEMTTLLGKGNICLSTVATTEVTHDDSFVVRPNPFTHHISVSDKKAGEEFKLTSEAGERIYEGTDLEQQDFSNLPFGVYYLQSNRKNAPIRKLIKQ